MEGAVIVLSLPSPARAIAGQAIKVVLGLPLECGEHKGAFYLGRGIGGGVCLAGAGDR